MCDVQRRGRGDGGGADSSSSGRHGDVHTSDQGVGGGGWREEGGFREAKGSSAIPHGAVLSPAILRYISNRPLIYKVACSSPISFGFLSCMLQVDLTSIGGVLFSLLWTLLLAGVLQVGGRGGRGVRRGGEGGEGGEDRLPLCRYACVGMCWPPCPHLSTPIPCPISRYRCSSAPPGCISPSAPGARHCSASSE